MAQDSRVRVPASSFIVRVWNDAKDDPRMRGEVEHVGTGKKHLFLDSRSLMLLLERWRHDLAHTP